MSLKRVLSVVVPCYNEEDGIPLLRERLEGLRLPEGWRLEVVLVDDGSSDRTWEGISAWAKASANVRGVRLPKNRGNQQAMLAGIAAADGTHVAVMDADLQDPPEALSRMAELAQAGAPAVIGLKRRRADGSGWLGCAKSAAMSLLSFRPGEGDFCVLERGVSRRLAGIGDASTPFRVRRYWALRGMKPSYLAYDRDPRSSGETKFSLPKLALLWWRFLKGVWIDPGRRCRP